MLEPKERRIETGPERKKRLDYIKAREEIIHNTDSGFYLPCRMDLIGASGSGKTVELLRLLQDNKTFFKKFRFICRFSPTADEDPAWQDIYTEFDGWKTFEMFDDSVVGQIWAEQCSIPKEKREHILLIIDDNAYDTRKGDPKWLNKVYISGRHKYISVIRLIQKLKMAAPVQLEQLTDLMMWPSCSAYCVKQLEEQVGALLDPEMFRCMFLTCTKEPFNYFHSRRSREGGHMQILKNAEEVIIDNVNQFWSQVYMQQAQQDPRFNRIGGAKEGDEAPLDGSPLGASIPIITGKRKRRIR